MQLDVIDVIELFVIIILLLIIWQYEKERHILKQTISEMYKDMGYRMSAQIETMLKYTNAIRHILPKELYTKSYKKNCIVRETCNLFYEKLTNKLK